MRRERTAARICLLFVAAALAACNATVADLVSEGPNPGVIERSVDTKYYASDESVKKGILHFNDGDYGLSEKYFRAAVEKTPTDLAAWVGLAASYDRLRRFDLADRAYEQAIALRGPTVYILNNQGYSYLLRGDLKAARVKFEAAYAMAPLDPTIRNNLILLDGSHRYVKRFPPAY